MFHGLAVLTVALLIKVWNLGILIPCYQNAGSIH